MDQRETLRVNESFYQQLRECHDRNEQIAILYEDSGVTRLSGRITAFFETKTAVWVEVDAALEIRVDALYAVNGTFSPDYTEC